MSSLHVSIPDNRLVLACVLGLVVLGFAKDLRSFEQSNDRGGKDVKPYSYLTASSVDVTDWPQWGGNSHRNNVSSASDLPTDWSVEGNVNLRWTTRLGSQVNNTPIIENGQVFIGTNNAGHIGRYTKAGKEIDLATLVCLDEETGHFLWQFSSENRILTIASTASS